MTSKRETDRDSPASFRSRVRAIASTLRARREQLGRALARLHVKRLARTRTARLSLVIGALVGAYALFGFQVAPRLVRDELIAFVHKEYGRTLRLGEVRVHPFKLYVELRDVALPDADGAPLLGLRRLFVDFQGPRSLWERAYVFREITLEQPALRLVVRPDGAVNVADLAGSSKEQKPERSDGAGKLPALWVQALRLDRGRVDFIDRARGEPFAEHVEPLSFALRDFRTTPRGGAFALSAVTREGAELGWKGTFALSPAPSSEGEITLAKLPLASVADYLADVMPVAAKGALDLRGALRFRLGSRPELELTLPEVRVRDLELRARRQRDTSLAVAALDLADVRLVLQRRALELGRVTITKLSTHARREADGSLNLTHLFSTGARRETSSPNVPAWSFKLHELALSDAALEFEDRLTPVEARAGARERSDVEARAGARERSDVEARAVARERSDGAHAAGEGAAAGVARFRLAPIDATLKDVSSDLAQPVALEAAFSVHGGGRVRASGQVTPVPLAADLALKIEDLALALAQPYVMQRADLTIHEGRLAADGKVAIRAAAGPRAAYRGDLRVSDLRTTDNVLRQDLVDLKELEAEQLSFELAPTAFSVERVRVQYPYARVVLSPRQVLNVVEVLQPPGERAAAARAAPAARAPEQAEPSTPVRIGAITVEGLRMNFSDFFIRPNFAADVQSLSGTIRGLSSEPKAMARVELKGRVGANAPVVISGKLQPFAYDKFTDLDLRCQNIPLAIFNPYSGRFAGYNITRGELTTEIHYQLKNRKLEAAHAIRIDQLTWGEATESKEKAPLPVKLATALLRDRNGVIHLDLPVQGTLDDPAFHVWPLIWQALKNTAEKAVTAPFELLGSLFRGAEKARFVEFAAGSAELDANAKASLAALAKALAERPELTVDVPVRSVAALDRAGLVERKYRERVASQIRATQRGKAARTEPPPFEGLDVDDRIDLLSDVYEDLTGSEPAIPDPPKPAEELPRKRKKELKKAFELEFLERATRAKISVANEELEELGRGRGEAIEAALVEQGQLNATRVLLSNDAKVAPAEGRVRFELAVNRR